MVRNKRYRYKGKDEYPKPKQTMDINEELAIVMLRD
jgi:hypothetical protein